VGLPPAAAAATGAALRRPAHARLAAAAEAEERALRAESAAAMAAVGNLGAKVLAAAEDGQGADPAAAERHATARLLYDQAHTSAAMVEVRRVAEEGLDLLAPAPAPRARKRRTKQATAKATVKATAKAAVLAAKAARRKKRRR
jgi:hypothetical protein